MRILRMHIFILSFLNAHPCRSCGGKIVKSCGPLDFMNISAAKSTRERVRNRLGFFSISVLMCYELEMKIQIYSVQSLNNNHKIIK